LPIPPPPLDASTAAALQQALHYDAVALAAIDAQGLVQWCNARFAALLGPAAAPLHRLDHGLSPIDARRLMAGEAVEWQLPAGTAGPGGDTAAAPWRLQAGAPTGAGLQLVRAEPLGELDALRRRIAQLQERLELVQTFSQTGVFERDATTLDGTWDGHMYRIWGLPERAPGALAPGRSETAQSMFREDLGDQGFAQTLSHPGPHAQRVRIRRPDGQVRHLNTRWQVFHDPQGRPLRVLGTNTDDTEVYEQANRAEQLRTELDAALALGHIGLWRQALDSDRVLFDARGREIIGVPYDERGVAVVEARARIHPDDRPRAAASLAATLRTGLPSDMALRYPKPGGGWKHVLLRRALQRSPDGAPLGFIGVLLDVTERVEQDAKADESNRRLEAAAEAARIGLWSTEYGSPLPSWNRRMYTLFGLDPQAGSLAMDDWITRCVHADDRARVRHTITSWWQARPGALEIEFRIQRPSDGAPRWLLLRGELTLDSVGGLGRRAEGVAIDITEQQQVLRQLRQTVERMTLTRTAVGLGTWETDRGHQQIHWDAQMFRLRGIESPAREVSREEIAACLPADERSAVMAAQAGRVLDGEPWHTEFRVLRPDGQVRWITSHSVPVYDERGSEDRRIGVNWDSTEAHVAAEALRQRERALAESQAKSQAMSRISHELRTPLNAVLGFAQLLRLRQGDVDQHAGWLAHIDAAGRHLLALIDDVLDLSTAEAGELRMTRQAVALAPFVEATLPLVAADARAAGIGLHCGPVSGGVLADPVRLRQVLLNLLSNAIKYNRPGGQVRLSAVPDGQAVLIRVADTGLGIAPERLQHAFEPFNRLGAEASGIEGSGIGLAIVKVLVEQMGGSVQASSRPGQGTEFAVRLPAAPVGEPIEAPVGALTGALTGGLTDGSTDRLTGDAAAAPVAGTTAATSAAQPQQPPQPAPAQLLYIEDNEVNALLVCELLANRPAVQLEVAVNGLAGVQRARALQPDLILVDMLLPDIDGHAVLRALQADPRTAHIRCVALSANATPADLQAARAAGFVDYWTKPIHFDQFLRDLGALLGRTL
jgi:PAS domain S-box-containing protein